MLSLKVSDSLPHGTFKRVAQKYKFHNRTIRNLWKWAISNQRSKQAIRVESKYKNCRTPNILESKPMSNRAFIRDVATCLDLAPSMVWRLIKRGEIKTHSNPLHSVLTDAKKIRRMECILSLIQEDVIQRHLIYKAMHDFTHIDEKWFYLTKKNVKSLSSTQRKDLV